MSEIPILPRNAPDIRTRVHHALQEDRIRRSEGKDGVYMSSIGRCVRDLWAGTRGIKEQPPRIPAKCDCCHGEVFCGRMLSLFDLGSAVEDVVIRHLRMAGYDVLNVDENGEQFRVVVPYGDNADGTAKLASGRVDGLIYYASKWMLLEVKSANQKKFAELQEIGRYEEWNPGYASTLHSYMGLSQREDTTLPHPVDEALVVVVGKNDSDVHYERIHFNPLNFENETLSKLKAIDLAGDHPPPKPAAANGPGSKFCKWCSRSNWCYGPTAEVEFDE